jgi:hypothetical protein
MTVAHRKWHCQRQQQHHHDQPITEFSRPLSPGQFGPHRCPQATKVGHLLASDQRQRLLQFTAQGAFLGIHPITGRAAINMSRNPSSPAWWQLAIQIGVNPA